MSEVGPVYVTQTLYRYRPASMWALVRLLTADKHDRMIARDTRDALWCAFKIVRKTDEKSEAQNAVEHAFAMLDMFQQGEST